MKVDCGKYRANMPNIIAQTKEIKDSWESLYEFIRVFSAASHMPVIAVACYIGELYGVTDDLRAYIKGLCHFYKVREVQNTTCELGAVCYTEFKRS